MHPFSQQDLDALNAEAARADKKFGSQIDVPLGTGADEHPLRKMTFIAQMQLGLLPAGKLADLAKTTTDVSFNGSSVHPGTWVDIMAEEVFEAFAEEGGIVTGVALEEELLQVASTALRMRAVARHHRVLAEMRQREQETIEKYGVFENCHHRNYGTKERPASVHYDCIDCRDYYCDMCNYDRHQCGGCGEPHRHGEEPHPGVSCTDEANSDQCMNCGHDMGDHTAEWGASYCCVADCKCSAIQEPTA